MDIKALKKFLEADDAFISELIDGFLQDLPDAVSMVKKGIEQEDHNIVKRASHKLLSSARIFQLDRLVSVLEVLESDADNGEPIEWLSKKTDELEKVGNEVRLELEQDRHQLKV